MPSNVVAADHSGRKFAHVRWLLTRRMLTDCGSSHERTSRKTDKFADAESSGKIFANQPVRATCTSRTTGSDFATVKVCQGLFAPAQDIPKHGRRIPIQINTLQLNCLLHEC